MQPLTALVLLAACLCLHAHQHARTPRYLKDTFHELLGRQTKPLRRVISCARTLGVPKCISALGLWRAERALEALHEDSAACFNLTEDVENFDWKRYSNETDDEVQTQLLDKTQKLLRYRTLKFDMIPGYAAKLTSKNNGSLSVDIHHIEEVEGRGSMKKIKKEFLRLAPILLVPGMFMSAIVPFILPSFKMMIMMVGFMNQMALAGAIFTLLRNNAFNDQYNHKVIYVNNGYQNERIRAAASNNEEHFHSNHLGILYDDSKKHKESVFDDNFENIEEIPPLSVSPQWIKDYTDNKLLTIIRDQPHADAFFNDGVPIRRSKTRL